MEFEERRKELLDRYTKLRDEAAKDAKFNKGDLSEAFNNTELVMKWHGYRSRWLTLHHSFEYKRLEAWKKAFEYYKTDYPFTLSTKEEYQNLISCDPSYHEPAELSKITSDIIDFIDSTTDAMKARAWEIRTFLDWMKFSHGQ